MLVYRKGEEIFEIKLIENIPVFHKVAVADIEKDAPVYKYGQLIGRAVMHIARGCHVHDHNIKSPF